MTAKVQAFVLKDGSVIHKSVLDQYAIKTAESKQLPPDSFHNAYETFDVVAPLYNPEALARLMEINTYHYRAVKTKARDTAGLGWRLVPRQGIKNPDPNQKAKVEAFFNHVNPEYTLTELLDRVMVDYEATGNGYIEIIRDSTTDEPQGLAHVPSHTIRRTRDGLRYVQLRDTRHRYFKQVGLPEDVHMDTGRMYEINILPVEQRASEIMHIYNYTSRSDYYGIPDILPALGAILGDRERQEYNIEFFQNYAMPAYAVTVTGTDLDEEVVEGIKHFFQHDVKEHRHSTLVLSGQKDPNNPNSDPIEFKFHPLSTEVKEASFTVYRKDNRDEILSAHGVPPYRAGIAETGSLGGSTAVESTQIYKMSIIEPRQQMLEDRINKHILWDGFGATDWQFEFIEIDTSDEKHELEVAERLFYMGALSPNEVRQRFGLEPVDDPMLNRYYPSQYYSNRSYSK